MSGYDPYDFVDPASSEVVAFRVAVAHVVLTASARAFWRVAGVRRSPAFSSELVGWTVDLGTP
ncbi:MAG: hypothetical protein KIT58_02485 [Planctomycetota bacterium]|nr:hypothetical protein [Planctomycetota bacterium]